MTPEHKVPAGWDATEKTIHRTFRTGTFSRGMQFLTEVAKLAEAVDHHPDVILTYPTVIITLWTHEEGAVTAKDLALAEQIDRLWADHFADQG